MTRALVVLALLVACVGCTNAEYEKGRREGYRVAVDSALVHQERLRNDGPGVMIARMLDAHGRSYTILLGDGDSTTGMIHMHFSVGTVEVVR